jgi:hypothetical protein
MYDCSFKRKTCGRRFIPILDLIINECGKSKPGGLASMGIRQTQYKKEAIAEPAA